MTTTCGGTSAVISARTPTRGIKPVFILCYTTFMQSAPSYWQNWAEKLERWGLTDLTATILESAGPITTILAQLVYAGTPLFSGSHPEQWDGFAHMLDNPRESRAFATFLKESSPT
jgi:hypothetical protein